MIHFDERGREWVYSATALAALLLALFLPSSTKQVAPASRRTYLVLQVITLVSAIVGAKLAFLAGDLGWPLHAVTREEVVQSGRSITGGLLGGLLGAELAKPLLRYRELPNDWFAAKLPLSIAIGRVGCVVAGCCRGAPGEHLVTAVYSDGVPRFPAQLAELAFQLAAFGACYALHRGRRLRGRVFATYLAGYGVFRFFLEGVRDTPKTVSGLSVYQVLSLAMVLAGAASFWWYARRADESAP